MMDKIKNRFRKFGLLKILKTFITVILPGLTVYSRIKAKYGEDTTIFVGQHPGTGDVYLQSMLLKPYCEKKGIKDFVFTVIGVPAKKVSALFDIANVELLTLEESNHLVRLYKVMYDKLNLQINILHYHPMELYYDEYLGYLRNYRGLNFYDMMSLLVFEGISKKSEPKREKFSEENIERIFRKYKLKAGKTVLLAPYANSLNGISIEFWEQLVVSLNERGYSVCTNSFGLNEPPIKGTCGVAVSYNDLIEFAERAGTIICLRSGLCDIVSSAKCRKIILYPQQDLYSIMGGLGSSFEYFSLNKMGLCDDAIELEMPCEDASKINKIKKKILMAIPPALDRGKVHLRKKI